MYRIRHGLSTRMLAVLLPLVFAFCVSISAASEIYKWVDKDGVIHFSDRPPVNEQETEKIKIPDVPPPDPSSTPVKPKKADKSPLPQGQKVKKHNKSIPSKKQKNDVIIFTTSW